MEREREIKEKTKERKKKKRRGEPSLHLLQKRLHFFRCSFITYTYGFSFKLLYQHKLCITKDIIYYVKERKI
jgi:hypothetical protein